MSVAEIEIAPLTYYVELFEEGRYVSSLNLAYVPAVGDQIAIYRVAVLPAKHHAETIYEVLGRRWDTARETIKKEYDLPNVLLRVKLVEKDVW